MLAGAVGSLVLWAVASLPALDWINSVRFVSHVSMVTMAFTFFAAYMADKPTPESQDSA